MTNTIDTVRDQLGEHLRYAMIHGAASISLERLSCWAGILSRHIEQQPEQGAEGQTRSDESDVQSAAILKEVKSRIAHKIANWSSMNEREILWCLLQLTETIEGMLQREVTKTNT